MIVRVPASSANLGPGFDSFGVAWRLYNEIEFDLADEGLCITGCDPRYAGEDNLAYRAFRRVLAYSGRSLRGLRINFIKSEIPVSRGLGSSAALITAGVVAANKLYGLGLSKGELLDLATAVEGHPDNVAPALYGGLTVSLTEGEHAVTRRFPLSEKLFCTLLIPPFELSTALARSVMPKQVSMKDAVFNLSRAALLPRALADGDTELLRIAVEDRLHQPYRFGLIEKSEVVRAIAEQCGASALCISGAGSTLLCISDDERCGERLKAETAQILPDWKVIGVLPDEEGARVV